MVTSSLTKELKPPSGEKKQHFQQMLLVQLAARVKKNANQSILISFYNAQFEVDQGPPHKTRYTETKRGESGKEY